MSVSWKRKRGRNERERKGRHNTDVSHPGARALVVASSVCCGEDEDGRKGQKEVEKSTDIGHVSGQSNAEKTSLFFP